MVPHPVDDVPPPVPASVLRPRPPRYNRGASPVQFLDGMRTRSQLRVGGIPPYCDDEHNKDDAGGDGEDKGGVDDDDDGGDIEDEVGDDGDDDDGRGDSEGERVGDSDSEMGDAPDNVKQQRLMPDKLPPPPSLAYCVLEPLKPMIFDHVCDHQPAGWTDLYDKSFIDVQGSD
jgi:hypothetical protein